MRAVCALLLGLAVAFPSIASAQDPPAALVGGDYGIGNREWNGLSEFVFMAESRGHEVRAGTGLDFSKLRPTDRLVILYPTSELDTAELARFVIDGGKVLLADDYGASTGFLERLGIRRVPLESVEHTQWYLNRPGLPVVRRGGRHPLLVGVEDVVANHPSALTTRGGAILPFDDASHGLVYDMKLGRGKVIVVGDASLFINHMLEVRDNRAFVRNSIDYLCTGTPECKPYLLVGDFVTTGSYERVNEEEESLADILSTSMSAFNDALDDLDQYVPPHRAIYYASLLLMGGVIVFLFTVFPVKRAAPVVPEVGPPDAVHPLSEFEWNLQRYETASYQANYALPMSILKTEFEQLFYAEVADGEPIPPPDNAGHPNFLRRMARRYTDTVHDDVTPSERNRIYRQTLQLLTLFSGLPPRHRLFLDNEASFSERDLLRVHASATQILEHLGVLETYEQRTRPRVG